MLTSQNSITECWDFKAAFSFIVFLGFIATTNISSRKQNFPILPFLVSHTACVVSYPQEIWEAKDKEGIQSLGLFSGLKPYCSLDCALHSSGVPLMDWSNISWATGGGSTRRQCRWSYRQRYLNECRGYKEDRILQCLKPKSKTLNYSFWICTFTYTAQLS